MPGDESELHVQKQKNASRTTELEMNGIDLGGGISDHLMYFSQKPPLQTVRYEIAYLQYRPWVFVKYDHF